MRRSRRQLLRAAPGASGGAAAGGIGGGMDVTSASAESSKQQSKQMEDATPTPRASLQRASPRLVVALLGRGGADDSMMHKGCSAQCGLSAFDKAELIALISGHEPPGDLYRSIGCVVGWEVLCRFDSGHRDVGCAAGGVPALV